MTFRWLLSGFLVALLLAPVVGCSTSTQEGDDVKVTARAGRLPAAPKDKAKAAAPKS